MAKRKPVDRTLCTPTCGACAALRTEPKPKRKRLNTRAAGLRQAAGIARTLERYAKARVKDSSNDEVVRWWSGGADAYQTLWRELERLARAEARRGGE